MNVEVDVTFKIRATDDTPKASPPRPTLASLCERITSHPYIVMLLREIVRHS